MEVLEVNEGCMVALGALGGLLEALGGSDLLTSLLVMVSKLMPLAQI